MKTMNNFQLIKEKLESFYTISDSNITELNDLCEEIYQIDKNAEQSLILIRPLLNILEINPNYYFGMPGCVVHTLETYYKKRLEQHLYPLLSYKMTA